MRAFKARASGSLSKFAVAILFAAACQRDLPTEADLDDVSGYARHTTAALYTSVNLGVLPGDNSSRANAVNDAGEVVGYSCCSPNSRAFITVNGTLTALSSNPSNALAISNGSTRYVVGWAGDSVSLPVRWSISGNTASAPVNLGLGAATWGAALGVNDAGAAVGRVGADAAMWDVDGNLTIISSPSGFTSGEGRDINNSGEAVFVFRRPDEAWPEGIWIGYLRLSNGDMIPLPSQASDGTSYANSISSAVGNLVQIAGTSNADPSSPRALKWSVDITTGQIVSVTVRSESSHAVGIANGGAAAGFTEGPTNSLKSNAFRWSGTELLTLSPPKGAKDGKGWGISANGTYVAGEAMSQLSRRAILWTMASQ
jgi:probable HAF family extracellular repeat protein